MTKIIIGLLILTVFLILPAAAEVSGKVLPDRESIYNESVKKPVSNDCPIFLTKFFSPESFKSTQQSEIAGFSDLLISESVSPATFTQRSSTVARLTDGQTVVGWTDDRNGNKMIFIQIFNSDGTRSGSNILAIGREDQNDISGPQIVSDGSGGFYLGWRDETTGSLYVARFNGDLTRNTEFRISNPALGYAGLYDLASYPGGKLAAVWEQFSIKSSINFRIFSSAGAPLTENITINTDDGSSTYRSPSIAVEPSGNLAIAWEDYRNGNADIYMQFVNSDGSLYGANRRIIDFDYLIYEQYLPEIVYSVTDGYIISWLDKRSGTQRVFLQRVTRAAGLIGANVNISNNAENFTDWYISMAVNSSGNLMVAWASVDGIDKILLQEFSAGVIPDDTIITVSEFPSGSKWETAIKFDNADNLYCTWSDSRRGNWDIMLKQYNSDSSPLSDDDIIVNDDAEGAHSTQLVVSRDSWTDGNIIAFVDKRYDEGDIFLQLFDQNQQQLFGNNIKINSDIIPALQKEPHVATIRSFDGQGVVVTWVDSRAINGLAGQRIFATYCDYPDIGQHTIISDTNSITPKAEPRIITSTSSGWPLVAWVDYENGDGQIYARNMKMVSNNDFKWSDIHSVSFSDSEFDNIDINLMVEDYYSLPDTSIFTIAWLSRGIENGPSAIFAKHRSSTFELVERFGFTSDQTGQLISQIAAVSNANGDIYLLWVGEGLADYLYLTVFDRTGNIIHPTYDITGGIGGIKEGIDIAVDSHGAVIATWVDDRNSRDEVFYQIFYPDMTPSGSNKPASATEQRYMKSPTVAMDGQNAVIAWVDPRANGHNVYKTQIDYSSTDIDDTDPDNLPSGYILEQNYPNPFNPTTSIQFALPTKSNVKLEVFNLLGQKIAIITDGQFEAGRHTVNWDGTNSSGGQVASGIYFYRLEADGFEQTLKMILLK